MALPSIANAFRVELIWTSSSAPRRAQNTLVFTDVLGTQNAAALYAALNANVTRTMWQTVAGASCRIANVEITEFVVPNPSPQVFTTVDAKWTGGSLGEDPILQGAVVVSLKTALAGKSHRGRIYLPWTDENDQASGQIDSTPRGAIQLAWEVFIPAMLAADWQLGVFSPKLATVTDVTNVVVRPNLLTQRRRARR